MKKIFYMMLTAALALTAQSAVSELHAAKTGSTDTPLWMRYPNISPDGTKIAFSYQGDIYYVPAAGGEAVRLTSTEDYEYQPVWSPDSRTVAFASDRFGGMDIFTVGIEGGKAVRLTTHSGTEAPLAFSPDGKYIYFSAAIQDPASSALWSGSWLTELYRVPVTGGRPEQIAANPIWITVNPGEDRDPIFTAPGQMVFLSERDGGSFNVYSAAVDDAENATALTHFTKHPVRFLSRADNGTLCFGYHGEIYTLTPGSEPAKVNISILNDNINRTSDLRLASVDEIAISDDGEEIALISRGEVFATTGEYGSTKQITRTAAAEEGLTVSPDGKTIVYASERTGRWNLYKATLAREDDMHFAYATLINEEPLLKEGNAERSWPSFSPDGKELAFIEDRHILKVLNLESGKVRQITDGTQNYGEFEYDWSPDGKWFTLTFTTNRHYPYDDIGIVSASGDMKIHNITNSGYIDGSPQWVMDGNAVIFVSDRLGMRSHASWGSQNDVYIAFMNRQAWEEFNMSEEEYALYKEKKEAAEKSAKEAEEAAAAKSSKGRKDKQESPAGKDETASKDILVELDGLEDRVVRLTPMSSRLGAAAMTSDGETLYFLSAFEKGYDLWELEPRSGSISLLKKGISAGSLAWGKDEKTLYILGRRPQVMTMSNKQVKPIDFNMEMELDRAAERAYMFDHVFKQEERKFYTDTYHGVDLPQLQKEYEPFLAHINNNYDFTEMISEILGELNVSHTGGRYGGIPADKVTPALGLLFDMHYDGDGLRIDEVLENGPFDILNSKVHAGTILEKIDGESIKAGEDWFPLINGKQGEYTLFSFYDPATGDRWEETARPISNGLQNELLYQRWIKSRAALVDSLSGGRLGYVHIRSMADGSYRDVYADVLGKYNLRDGIVIDIRYNGGGRLHEDVEILFSGEKYLEQVIQGTIVCDMPSRRYNKHSIMVVCEACYSNAHGTPWVYQHQGLGSIVGMPVPGTMTSVNWETMQDPALVFGIPVVGYRTKEGTYLENSQLEPDYLVRNKAEEVVNGRDEQIEVAVRELLKQIDADKDRW